MIVSNGEKFIKLDGYLSAIVYSNSDWKIFLTLLKIKNTEKEKIFTSQSVRSQTMNMHMIYFKILL